jgi:hypothetical protein
LEACFDELIHAQALRHRLDLDGGETDGRLFAEVLSLLDTLMNVCATAVTVDAPLPAGALLDGRNRLRAPSVGRSQLTAIVDDIIAALRACLQAPIAVPE